MPLPAAPQQEVNRG
nr:hypothetical protein [Salmonella enterica]